MNEISYSARFYCRIMLGAEPEELPEPVREEAFNFFLKWSIDEQRRRSELQAIADKMLAISATTPSTDTDKT